jgi:hypothetical protein
VKDALEEISTISGSVCVSRSKSISSAEFGGYRWAIRFDDINDDLRGNIKTESAAVTKEHKAITLRSKLHLQDEPFTDWETADGDIAMCTCRYAMYVSGAGSKELIFIYNILPGDEALPLMIQTPDIIRFDDFDGGIFKYLGREDRKLMESRYIAADLSWEGQIASNVFINTKPPTIVNITVDSTCGVNKIHRAGDVILVHVIFDKPVVVSAIISVICNAISCGD